MLNLAGLILPSWHVKNFAAIWAMHAMGRGNGMLGWGHWALWPCSGSHDGKDTRNCIAANFGAAIAACAGGGSKPCCCYATCRTGLFLILLPSIQQSKNQQAWQQVSLLDEMRYQQITSNIIVYNTALNILEMTERWEDALGILVELTWKSLRSQLFILHVVLLT